MNNDRGSKVLAIVGGVLVAVGAFAVIGIVLAPIAHLFFWLAGIVWPLALVALGVLLLTRSRRRSGQSAAAPGVAGKRLQRSRTNRVVGGVLAGIGDYMGLDPTVVRIAYVVLTLVTGISTGIVAYIVAMIVLPEQSLMPDRPVNIPAAPPVPGSPAGK